MPILMLKCKTCGEAILGIYVPEGSSDDFKSTATSADSLHTCSRGHKKNMLHDIIWTRHRLFLNIIIVDFISNMFFRSNFARKRRREILILKEVDVFVCRLLTEQERDE